MMIEASPRLLLCTYADFTPIPFCGCSRENGEEEVFVKLILLILLGYLKLAELHKKTCDGNPNRRARVGSILDFNDYSFVNFIYYNLSQPDEAFFCVTAVKFYRNYGLTRCKHSALLPPETHEHGVIMFINQYWQLQSMSAKSLTSSFTYRTEICSFSACSS